MTVRQDTLVLLGVFVIFAIGYALQQAINAKDVQGIVVTTLGAVALVVFVLVAGGK